MVMPPAASARTPAASRYPGVPSRPATTKKVAVSPRDRSAGSAMVTSDSLPSSNVMRTSSRPATESRTAANRSREIHTAASPASSPAG
jgi:hypothetical protein